MKSILLILFCLGSLLITICCTGCSGSAQADNGNSVLSLLGLSKIIRVPLTRQATDHTCGVASLQSILFYYGIEVREDLLAQELGTTVDSGTPYQNIVSYAQSRGFNVSVRLHMTLNDLKSLIDQDQPVLVPIQAWMNPLIDWSTYDEGHYVVVIGYDPGNIIFMDPSTLGHYTYIPNDEFMVRWHDQESDNNKLDQFGIIMTKAGSERYNPDSVIRML